MRGIVDKINKKLEIKPAPLCKMTKEKINYCIIYGYIKTVIYSKIILRRYSSEYNIKNEADWAEASAGAS